MEKQLVAFPWKARARALAYILIQDFIVFDTAFKICIFFKQDNTDIDSDLLDSFI